MKLEYSRTHTAIAALIWLVSVAPASASFAGINGFSGRSGFFCSTHHGGGVTPDVHFEGPSSAEPGEIVELRFLVRSMSELQVAAGLNLAASGGALNVVPSQGTHMRGPELTHTFPKDNDPQGVASWEFTWQAPQMPGEYVLYGAGNSVNNDDTQDGDAAAATTLSILVVGEIATPTPTPGPDPCPGDCDGDGNVTVSELILGVNIALGAADASACPAMDANGDGSVSVSELIAAVNASLNGCP